MKTTSGIYNGCGACSGFWKWLKPPKKEFFYEECIKHDESYDVGGDKYDRKFADLELFQAMILKSANYFNKRKPFSLWWFCTLSLIYYLAIRLFGKQNFNYKNK